MNSRVVLITKDAMCKSYLPVYGNKIWKTPNIDELAKKGTVFNRFYTVAPSTAMSTIGMFLQKNPYETKHKKYVAVEKEINTVFDKLENMGYECHILWDQCDVDLTKKYSECYSNSKFHIVNVDQVVGAHNLYANEIQENESLEKNTISTIESAIESITSSKASKLFLWIHLPQVLLGKTCYGSDMDTFDRIIGILRHYFNDDSIYISSDHGNMNGFKNKVSYGFDVYEPAVNIPLITPKINGLSFCNTPVSNVHIYEIMNGIIPNDEFIYCDCAYYAQPHRKLAIIKGNYKYIYNKIDKSEEYYDLNFDQYEQCNIISKVKLDNDRKIKTLLPQVYYYPNWDEAQEVLIQIKKEFNRIWKEESKLQRIKSNFLNFGKIIKRRIKQLFSKK